MRASAVLLLLFLSTATCTLPTLIELESILDRAISMTGSFLDEGGPFSPGFDDNLLVLTEVQARYVGRAAYLWGGESRFASDLQKFQQHVKTAKAAIPDIVVEACVFEIVTVQVNSLSVPADVFDAFDLPRANRTFNYSAMLFPDGSFVNQWGENASVPDWTQTETKLWVYFAASR